MTCCHSASRGTLPVGAGMKNSNNNNRTCHIVNCAVPVDHRVRMKESEKKRQILGSGQRTKKQNKKKLEHEGESRTNCNWCPRNGAKGFGKRSG